MEDSRATVTRILHGAAYGSDAVEEILPIVYDELKRVATNWLRRERVDHTLAPTELVHEAYLSLFGSEQMRYKDRRHFFATAAMAMRHILVAHARRKLAGKRIPKAELIPLDKAAEPADVGPEQQLIDLDAALEQLAKIYPRQARVVELRYFAGLTEAEVAEVLELSRPTVTRDWKTARMWLRREIRK